MAETEETLNGNWYKAAMGLRYAKEGIQQFVADEIDKFHKNVLQKLPPNYQCNTCTIQNVLQCPTPGTCVGRPCSFHDNTGPTKQYNPCPKNICGVIRDEVKYVHRYKSPTFKNSDAQFWYNNSWELAKCFMPQGYSDSTGVDDTDFSGLIGVILSHLDFKALITENLNQRGNKFEKAREVRHKIMHSPKMELSTIDMNCYFQRLTDVLSDKGHIQSLPKAQEAIKELQKLQQDLITITVMDKDTIRKEYELLTKVTDDGVMLIKETTKESIDIIKKKEAEGIENMIGKANDSFKTLQKEKEIGVESLKKTVEKSRRKFKKTEAELKSEVERATHEETKRAKKIIEEKKDVLVEDMKEEAKLQKQVIDDHTESSIDRIKALQAQRAMRPHQMVKDYDEKKKNLQKELIEHYCENGYCMSAIPVLIDDEEVDVANMFDLPVMISQQCKFIMTICDIFKTDGKPTRKACISGEAGYGKTTLCQKILSYWCKLHTNQQTESLPGDDETFLKSFDVLFYIPLRNHTTSDITEMIKAELVRRDMHDVLDQVLQKDSRKCFIILDGLDEWLLPEDCGERIPFIDPREKPTVLVTSRSWKLEILRPKNWEIGHEVKLCGVTDRDKYVMAVVDYLNKKRGEKKTLGDIFKEEQFRHVWHLLQIPSLLTQIVCMRYDDMDFGKTRVDIYRRMIDYYLQMAYKRQKDRKKQNNREFSGFESRKTENDCLLDIFRDLPFCKKYSNLLSRLSDLAFHTLFSEKREDSLVFPHSVTEIHKLNEVELKFCLKAGLLSQARFCSKVTLETKKLSFIHKTFQEFLAAVFIANNDNKFKDMLQTLSCLKDVFEMEEFMRFLSGLRPDLIYDMSKHVADLTDKNEEVTIYRKSVIYNDFVLTRIDNLIHGLVQEGFRCSKGEMVDKVIIRDLFLSYPDMLKEETCELIEKGEIKSISICNKELKANVFSQLPMGWKTFQGENLCKVKADVSSQKDVDLLIDMMQKSLSSLISFEFSYRSTKLQEDNVIYVDYKRFFSTLMDTTCLTSIDLNNLKLDYSDIKQLGQFLSNSTQLKEIELKLTCCITCVHTPCVYEIHYSNQQKLLKIQIYQKTRQFTLREDLPLECCEVEECKCAPSVIHIAYLKSSESLQTLIVDGRSFVYDIRRCTTKESDDRKAPPSSSSLSTNLTTVIPTFRNLNELCLSFIDFGPDLLRLSSDMIYLRSVELHHCTQTLESFKCFIDSLPKTQGVLNVLLCTKLTSQDDSDLYLIVKNYLLQRHISLSKFSWADIPTKKMKYGHLYISF